MTFLRTQRSKFIAWMVIYALGVMLMFSKGGAEGLGFVWGLALGVGAGIATVTRGPIGKVLRLRIVLAWLLASWVCGMTILSEDLAGSTWSDRATAVAAGTLLAGLPALLALLVWIFRRPKLEVAARSTSA